MVPSGLLSRLPFAWTGISHCAGPVNATGCAQSVRRGRGGSWHGRGDVHAGNAGHERLRARGRRRLPHLLGVRAWVGSRTNSTLAPATDGFCNSLLGRAPVARPCASAATRACSSVPGDLRGSVWYRRHDEYPTRAERSHCGLGATAGLDNITTHGLRASFPATFWRVKPSAQRQGDVPKTSLLAIQPDGKTFPWP